MKSERTRSGPAGPSSVVVNLPGGAVESDAAAPADPSADLDALDDALAQLPDNVIAKLYRIRDDGRKAFIMEGAPSALSETRIAKHGPGDYVVIFWGPLDNGTKRNGYRGSRRVFIGENGETSATAPVAAPTASSLDAAVATMLTSMISQQSAAAQQQAESSRTMNALIMTMMKDHSAMLAAQLQAMSKPAADPLETAERLTKLITPPTRGNFGDFMKDYQAFRELTGGGEGGGDEHWGAQIARAVVPHLLNGPASASDPRPVVTAAHQNPDGTNAWDHHAVTESHGPVPSAHPAPAAIPVVEAPPVPNDLVPLMDLLPRLRTARALNLSPEVVADAILDATDDDDTLEALLTRPGLVADIHRLAPDVSVDWLDRIRQCALDALRESVGTDGAADDRGDDDPAAPPGG